MTESQRDALALERDIHGERERLAGDIERLRAALRFRFSPRAQLRAHPRVAIGLGLVLALPLILLALAARAVLAPRRRQRWLLRP